MKMQLSCIWNEAIFETNVQSNRILSKQKEEDDDEEACSYVELKM